VDILTFGQYLQPTPKHLPVTEFVTPEKFAHWQRYGEEVIGFRCAAHMHRLGVSHPGCMHPSTAQLRAFQGRAMLTDEHAAQICGVGAPGAVQLQGGGVLH
jgi:hypothetical protein